MQHRGGPDTEEPPSPPRPTQGGTSHLIKILDLIQLQSQERGPRKERVLANVGSQVYSARRYVDCRDCIASANLTFSLPPTRGQATLPLGTAWERNLTNHHVNIHQEGGTLL